MNRQFFSRHQYRPVQMLHSRLKVLPSLAAAGICGKCSQLILDRLQICRHHFRFFLLLNHLDRQRFMLPRGIQSLFDRLNRSLYIYCLAFFFFLDLESRTVLFNGCVYRMIRQWNDSFIDDCTGLLFFQYKRLIKYNFFLLQLFQLTIPLPQASLFAIIDRFLHRLIQVLIAQSHLLQRCFL